MANKIIFLWICKRKLKLNKKNAYVIAEGLILYSLFTILVKLYITIYIYNLTIIVKKTIELNRL